MDEQPGCCIEEGGNESDNSKCAKTDSAAEELSLNPWFPCPGCDRTVTSLVRSGHPHPGKHHYYSYTHCCLTCESGSADPKHSEDQWACAGVPTSMFRQAKLSGSAIQSHYLLHDPGPEAAGGVPLPAVLFLHGANTYLYPETLWWDLRGLLEQNKVAHDEFFIVAPFGAIGEPVARASTWTKANRFKLDVPYVDSFDVDATWETFLRALEALGSRVDLSRLHVMGFSMGGQAVWSLALRYGSQLASAVPMAACCKWPEDAWASQDRIIEEVRRLPVWSYCGEQDTRTVSWRDFGWLADRRGLQTKSSESLTSHTELGIDSVIHDWGPDLSLTLVRGTRSCHCIWDMVFHNEEFFGLFRRLQMVRCDTPMESVEDGLTPFPASCEGRQKRQKQKWAGALVLVFGWSKLHVLHVPCLLCGKCCALPLNVECAQQTDQSSSESRLWTT
ncbi:unnamed protein product [Polarella glacialis]|uniref:Uncharacterized protein n=1 Tax=Polarella glacialis TaxID=89957 RepID=A0A813GQU2_POLGL|nr:unnamed protein product [Polarella glacialis]